MTIAPSDLYTCVCNSLIRFGEDFRKANNPGAAFFDWDAHADIAEMPEQDCMGPAGIGLADEGKIQQVVFAFGLSTVGDPNLFRLRGSISKLYGLLRPEAKIPVYDTVGTVHSWMVVKSPLTIAPVSKAEVRSIQFITAMALLDPHATAST